MISIGWLQSSKHNIKVALSMVLLAIEKNIYIISITQFSVREGMTIF